ncbi:MAG: hypothetical protein ACUVQ1_05120 [Candidatus Kapaibacteriales bacterium]
MLKIKYKGEMKKFSRVFFILAVWFLFPMVSNSQDEATRTELEQILSRFSNYRFGSISIYKVKNVGDIRRAIKLREERASGIKIDEGILKAVDAKILEEVENGVRGGLDIREIIQSIERKGIVAPERSVLDQIYQFYRKQIEGGSEQRIENAYLITTRTPAGEIPKTIIALVVTYNPSPSLEKNLKNVGTNDIYTYDEMKNFELPDTANFSAKNLYDLMMNTLIQRNCENKTIEAQGLGNTQWFAHKVFGRTVSPFENEADLSSFDIQKMIRISEGEPFNFGLKQNEVLISPDWILWRRFPLPGYYDYENFVIDSLGSSNNDLPLLGIELRYGIDGINYSSFFSERLTASAIWQNVKLGVILPTDGWASVGKDVFNIQRKLTYGGAGIAGSFDFPIKVIPKSGVFHFDFGYVFGDAKESKYKNRNIDTLVYNPWTDAILTNDFDYLVRANFQAYYTFGLKIDEYYYFRLGLGGTFYKIEKWYVNLDTTNFRRKLVYEKYDEISNGDVSIRFDFMSTNIVTPFGANIQYFNGGIGAGVWLQVPIIANSLALRLDATGFFNSFKDKPEEWENKGYFVPMVRIIVNF